jgi:preprotein translocase subunit SecE
MDENLKRRNKAVLIVLVAMALIFYIVSFIRYPGLS